MLDSISINSREGISSNSRNPRNFRENSSSIKDISGNFSPKESKEYSSSRETKEKVTFASKFKHDILNKIKYEFEKNQQEFINPIINHFIDQFHFEFKIYLIIAELGLLLVIILFIINICFIVWISQKII